MTYNVFVGTLSLTQSINQSSVQELSRSQEFYDPRSLTLTFDPVTFSMSSDPHAGWTY